MGTAARPPKCHGRGCATVQDADAWLMPRLTKRPLGPDPLQMAWPGQGQRLAGGGGSALRQEGDGCLSTSRNAPSPEAFICHFPFPLVRYSHSIANCQT